MSKLLWINKAMGLYKEVKSCYSCKFYHYDGISLWKCFALSDCGRHILSTDEGGYLDKKCPLEEFKLITKP